MNISEGNRMQFSVEKRGNGCKFNEIEKKNGRKIEKIL